MRTRGWSMVAAVVVVALAACGSDAETRGGDDGSREVTLGIGIRTPVAQQAMETYLPIALGYWEEEGLDVSIQGFDGTGAAVQALVAGQVDVANSTGTNTVASANLAGSPLRCFVVGITSAYQKIVKLPETGIAGVEDFAGHKVGVLSLESSQYNWINAALRDAGVDPAEVEFVPVGQGPEAAQALEAGQIDALIAYDGAALAAQELVGAVQVPSPYLDALGFNTCMTVEDEKIADDRDLYVGLARGYVKAIVFAKENPEAAVKAFWEAYPDGRPTGDLDAALASTVQQLEARLESMQPHEDQWGSVSDATVQAQIDALVSGGAIEQSVEVDDVWTDELIADINDFDVDAVRTQAREWQE